MRLPATLFCTLATLALLAPAAAHADALVRALALPRPQAPGDIVAFAVANPTRRPKAAHFVRFGEVFRRGALPRGRSLVARLGGPVRPVQADVKTRYPDGSARFAVLTLRMPALASATARVGMLARAPVGAAVAAPLDLVAALTHHRLSLRFAFRHADGTTTRGTIRPLPALIALLKTGNASFWRRGPLVSEARIIVPVVRAFRLVFDISADAAGGFGVDITFANDIAMGRRGTTLRYGVAIAIGGKILAHEDRITQYQYQDWRIALGTAHIVPGQIIHDIAYLESTGAVATYDLKHGIAASLLAREARTMAAPGWSRPLAADGVSQYMPATGGRDDIGPTTMANAAWLISQSVTAARYALGQADAAAAIPWHFYYPKSGEFLTTADIPNIWTEPGAHINGVTVLTQLARPVGGWTPDISHQPDLSFIPYLLTGRRADLDELNAQATWTITGFWPSAMARNNGAGWVVQGNQVRGSAWALREIVEAAFANPDGSTMKRYFAKIAASNFHYLLDHIPTWTKAEGEASGWLPEDWGTAPDLAPWQQDYFASTIVAAARMDVPGARRVLAWEANYLVGRVLPHPGWNRRDGVAYALITYDRRFNAFYPTWASIERHTVAAHLSNGPGPNWPHSRGDYAALALQSLAGVIDVLPSPAAWRAWHWLRHSGAPYIDEGTLTGGMPQFAIVPPPAN